MSAVPASRPGASLPDLLKGFVDDVPAIDVADVAADSNRVVAGGLFLACAGEAGHGLDYLDDALGEGIAAVAWEPRDRGAALELPAGVVGIRVPGLRAKLGRIANRYFGKPSSDTRVVGITGTNGKSSVAWLAAQAGHRLGACAGYMGTLGYGRVPDVEPTRLTTPDCIEFHRRLRSLADDGVVAVMAEVSSHGLSQARVAGVEFCGAALTNLSRDHLDYHANMQEYGQAKAKLFVDFAPEFAVINTGDAFGAELVKRLAPDTRLISVRVDTSGATDDADIVAQPTRFAPDGLTLEISGRMGSGRLDSPLWGRFNAENLAMAAGILTGLGHSFEDVLQALAECQAPPGRMERIPGSPGQPLVVVDFAHTPDALEKALTTLREHCNARIWCVFGCGGDRDPGKRAPMGAVAASLADKVVITDDNPRTEDPVAIARQIAAGSNAGNRIEIVQDRGAAIRHAIHSASADDVVLIAGKGHEQFQLADGKAVAFSDGAMARAALGFRQ